MHGRSRSTHLLLGAATLALAACATLPEPEVKKHSFPENVFVEDPGRPYETVGRVRSKVEWQSLNPTQEEEKLCANYYNKGAIDLLKRARAQGADAVIQLRSVTFLIDGRVETHKTPQCSDDGQEGQVLVEGLAVRWKRLEVELEPTRGKLQPSRGARRVKVPRAQASGFPSAEDLPPPKPRASARPVPQKSHSDTEKSRPASQHPAAPVFQE